jgi:methylase of polypeptide subunit release factors
MIGAAQWRLQGIEVPGLPGRLHPHYGVFTPTRGDYTSLLATAPSPEGKRVFDIGTGTGVLGFLLLARGAKAVVGTDLEKRAVDCANENARSLGFADRFEAVHSDLFPEGKADLVVCNPPWVPERPKTALDRAVFDPGGKFLEAFLTGLSAHLTPGGEGWLIISDLPELLGLRQLGELDAAFARAGLEVAWRRSISPAHPKVHDQSDPLHPLRARENTHLIALVPRQAVPG